LHRLTLAAPLLLALGTAACVKEKTADDGRVPLSASSAAPMAGAAGAATTPAPVMTPEGQSLLDAGNAAFRKKDYTAAKSAFEKAAKLSPEHAAPWFGLYMVAQARKDNRAADSALAQIRLRADGPTMMPGGAPGATPGPLPAVIDTAAMNRAHAKAGVGSVKP
jgi:Flp pilus assembly protein TadD